GEARGSCCRQNCYGCLDTSAWLEGVAGVWDYLFGLGIYVLCDPGWGAGGAAVFAGGDAVFDCRRGALWVDAGAGRARAERAGVGIGGVGGVFVFWDGLRMGVLGGAAGRVGADSGDAGDDSGVHGAIGNIYIAVAASSDRAAGGVVD